MTGRERLNRRHQIHVVVREAIDEWNCFRQIMHMGHKIDLAAAITEALMASAICSSLAKEPKDVG